MIISDKLYNVLKWVALVGLPGLGAFYYGLSLIWGLPFATQIVGTLALVNTLLGTCLGISTINYNAQLIKQELADEKNTQSFDARQ